MTIRSETPLRGRTILMSGGSRGIGHAIGLRAAHDGANVALLAKTRTAPPTGRHRSADIKRAVAQAAERFGGIDVVVNNASAIDLSRSTDLPAKKFDGGRWFLL